MDKAEVVKWNLPPLLESSDSQAVPKLLANATLGIENDRMTFEASKLKPSNAISSILGINDDKPQSSPVFEPEVNGAAISVRLKGVKQLLKEREKELKVDWKKLNDGLSDPPNPQTDIQKVRRSLYREIRGSLDREKLLASPKAKALIRVWGNTQENKQQSARHILEYLQTWIKNEKEGKTKKETTNVISIIDTFTEDLKEFIEQREEYHKRINLPISLFKCEIYYEAIPLTKGSKNSEPIKVPLLMYSSDTRSDTSEDDNLFKVFENK